MAGKEGIKVIRNDIHVTQRRNRRAQPSTASSIKIRVGMTRRGGDAETRRISAISDLRVSHSPCLRVGLTRKFKADKLLDSDESEEQYLISRVSWQQYEILLNRLGDRPWYRVAYLEGVLEIMAPIRRHGSKML
ncbi:MAG: hypothetical protein AAFV72_08800 [Cyanobacteria bacterium J06635_1]